MADWEQQEVFPLIAEIIRAEYSPENEYVLHDRIAVKLAAHDVGQSLVTKVVGADANRTKEQVASNMVAWFSQKISEGKSDYPSLFYRVRIEGKYAYRPIE